MNESPLSSLPQRIATPSEKKPIVIFGAGSIVKDAHLPAYRKSGYEIAGIYDPEPNKASALAAKYGILAFTRLRDALAIKNAVYDLATPPAAHAEILSQLPKGAYALVQKPFGADLSAASEILKQCEARNIHAAVNFQLRFAPLVIALKAAIDGDLLGDIVDIEMHGVMATPWGLWQFLKGLPRIEITMHSIHYLDLIRHLIGNPKGVHAKTIGHPSHDMAQTRTSAILDYGDEIRCLLSINHDWDYGRDYQACEMRVAGTKGAAYLQFGVNLDYPKGEPDKLCIKTRDADWQDISLQGTWFPDAFVGRMHNLQCAAIGEAELISSAADGWQTMALVEACYQSSASPMTSIPVHS